ncbi:MAG TPA: HEAT repeat domain-containing protein [Gemmataceae bacterium]|nr:HEAT repeat domain-containing protein [Gemmataceae bacterium]
MRRLSFALAVACLLPSAAGAGDEEVLRGAKVGTDGPALLDFLRRHTLGAETEARVRVLVRQLGDDSFDRRERASRELVALGGLARPFLRQAATDPDAEVARRAQDCLRQIDKKGPAAEGSPQVAAAALRRVARLKPAGAARVLLAYLPSAEGEALAEEVRQALAAVALKDGKPEPLLVAALADKLPARRLAAAVALCRARATEALPAVRKLLDDPDAAVRFRAAVALAGARDREAIAALIRTLDGPPSRQTSLVEELLYRVAEGKAPPPAADGGPAARRRYRQAWEGWWKGHAEKVDGAKLEEVANTLGCTLIVLLDAGRVLELDALNRPRLEVDKLEYPLDAQLLPGDRVLAAEYNAARVTERDRDGKVLWEYKVPSPLAAQRLANGNTFIATIQRAFEVDKAGAVVSTFTPPRGEEIMKAQKLPNGDLVMVGKLGTARYLRFDSSGKELKSFGVDLRTSGGRLDVLPNGHVLIPERAHNRVVEHDADGKVVWEATVEEPVAAVRLPNGNTLVTSMTQNRAVELDRAGKEVWQYKGETRVTRAFRR